jgi:hypothetical protein
LGSTGGFSETPSQKNLLNEMNIVSLFEL